MPDAKVRFMKIKVATAVMSFALLAGCGTRPVGRSMYPATIDVPGQAAPSVQSAATAQQVGSIKIVFSGGQYTTQATSADVASLQVTVTPASGEPITQTVAKGANAEIDNIPVGAASLTVIALDANANNIGSATQSDIEVVAGQVATVDLSLQLDPTVIQGGGSQTGGIAVNISLLDGATVSASPSPTQSPTPSPTQSPTPSPTASPTPSGSSTAVSDGFENGFANWTAAFTRASYSSGSSTPASDWAPTTAAAKTGSYSANAGNQSGNVYDPGTYLMTYASSVDTGTMTNPTLTFDFENFIPQYYFKTTSFAVETSTDDQNWTQAWSASAEQDSWAHTVVSLPHSGTLYFRFDFKYDYYLGSDYMNAPYVDNVVVSDGGN